MPRRAPPSHTPPHERIERDANPGASLAPRTPARTTYTSCLKDPMMPTSVDGSNVGVPRECGDQIPPFGLVMTLRVLSIAGDASQTRSRLSSRFRTLRTVEILTDESPVVTSSNAHPVTVFESPAFRLRSNSRLNARHRRMLQRPRRRRGVHDVACRSAGDCAR